MEAKSPDARRRAAPISLDPNWFEYRVCPGVEESRPGIYEWHIEGVGTYIGKYTSISRPTRRYGRNLLRMLHELPPLNGRGFRHVHFALYRAVQEKKTITLTILENVEPSRLNARERALIAERGTLNGSVPTSG